MIYSNAAFVGNPETGMRYFNAQKDSGTGLRPLPKGAVEFVSTPASVAKLMQQIPGAGNQMKAFEALLT